MATLLYRLGRAAYRRPLLVLLIWLLAMGAALGAGLGLGGKTDESFSIPGTEAQNAIDRLSAVFPQAGGASGQAVVSDPDGIESGSAKTQVEDLAKQLGDVKGIAQALSPYSEYASGAISDDGTTAIIQLQFDGQQADVTDATLDKLTELGDAAEGDGLTVDFGGQAFQDQTVSISPTEGLGVLFAALVLIVAFGSFLAAGLPLLTAFAGLGVSMGGVLAVAAFAPVSSAGPMLALMLGLAVGIDYALFIVSRHRTQLARGMDPEESAATAVATAGSAVVFAGVTVVIALAGLLVVGIPFLAVMGIAAAAAVVLAMLAALTLLPAVLGLAKHRLIPKPGSRTARRLAGGAPAHGDDADQHHGAHEAPVAPDTTATTALSSTLPTTAPNPGDAVPAHAAPVAPDTASTTALPSALPTTPPNPGDAVPAHAAPVAPEGAHLAEPAATVGNDASASASGSSSGDAKPAKPAPIPLGERWVRLVTKVPALAIVLVVGILGVAAIPAADLQLALPNAGHDPKDTTARQAYDTVADKFGPGKNGPLVVVLDITQTTDPLGDLKKIGDRLADVKGVAEVGAGVPNETVDTGIIQLTPTTAPDDQRTSELVQRLRGLAPEIEKDFDTPMQVSGATAVQIDVSNRLDSALLPFGILVVGLSVILLALVFRSIVVPIKAAVGFLLSVLAAFGVVVAVFQWGWGAELLHAEPGPILSFMPVLLMAILFGLAMDYEVFLVSGMREDYVHGSVGKPDSERKQIAKRAVVTGFRGAARVVTAAALIMFFVFAAFVPEGMGVIKVIALGLAVGIAVDAFLVRMTLVPAVMALFHRRAWYLPRWLDRILPDVDIEGAGLAVHRADVRWAEGRESAIELDALVAAPASQPEAGRDVVTGSLDLSDHGDRGSARPLTPPVSLRVPHGAIAVVAGEDARRRLLAATVAGRVPALEGRALVAGKTLPTEAADVARRVALGDLAASRVEADATAGELIAERMRFAPRRGRGGSGAGSIRRRAAELLDRLAAAGTTVAATDRLSGLSPEQRADVLAAAALAEGTPVVLLDVGDLDAAAATRVAVLAADLADPSTTLVLGVRPGVRLALLGRTARPVVDLDLTPEGATR
ncbi:MMPL family transporter [Schumannella sp. 10F1B-5-1]|uniref:MMPL family transporter n=1 Tax=Schumannella sp. 10F1B-5-1 TaxID=2590780 RepID=UPI001131973E|nr:MMPL family transporter [Schumannella sp. 10F1B-5-1]TPW78232.1 MMPL family transporter [Schumannella sp. 10F1B-5-1]